MLMMDMDSFTFSTGCVYVVEPFGLVGVVVHVQVRYEGFVAAYQHHNQQVGNHDHVYQVEHGEHNGGFVHRAEVGDELPQQFDEFVGINGLGGYQSQINRQLQPAAGEYKPCECGSVRGVGHGWCSVMKKARMVFCPRGAGQTGCGQPERCCSARSGCLCAGCQSGMDGGGE